MKYRDEYKKSDDFDTINEIFGGDNDYHKQYLEESAQSDTPINFSRELPLNIHYHKTIKIKVVKTDDQPVKQLKKPKKAKGIIKVIAGVGTVVLGILGIIYAIENSKPILPGSPYDGSNHYSQQQDDEYSYDDEPEYKGFTR